MREARIIFTHETRRGEVLYPNIHIRFLNWIVDKFGGYTATRGSGAYRHKDGRLQTEPVMIVDIAVSDDPGQLHLLRDIARTFCREADQECVYLRNQFGDVEFVTPEPQPPAPE
jgi:hypothetical protein